MNKAISFQRFQELIRKLSGGQIECFMDTDGSLRLEGNKTRTYTSDGGCIRLSTYKAYFTRDGYLIFLEESVGQIPPELFARIFIGIANDHINFISKS